jgi:hypothetical protein
MPPAGDRKPRMGRLSGPGDDAMPRKTLLASALAAAAFAGLGRAGAETPRLENVNGMQEVVHDQGALARPTVPRAAPRVVNEGGGEHGVAYDR